MAIGPQLGARSQPCGRARQRVCRWKGLSAPRCRLRQPTWGHFARGAEPKYSLKKAAWGRGLAPAPSQTPASPALPQHDGTDTLCLQGSSRARALSGVPSVGSSAAARRHSRAAGWKPGGLAGLDAGGGVPPGSLLPSPRIPSGSPLGRGGEPGPALPAGEQRPRDERCLQLPCMGKAGEGGLAAALRAGLARPPPDSEHLWATLPARPPGRRRRGHLARVSGPGPGRYSPEVSVPAKGSPDPPPSAPPPVRGARAPALPRRLPRRCAPRCGETGGTLRAARPAPRHPSGGRPRYLAGRRAGNRQRRGGAGRAASPPCWADPRWLRRRHRGGAGAGRRAGRGGAGGTWSGPGPGGAGRGLLPPPALPPPPASPSGPAPVPPVGPRTVLAPPGSVPGTSVSGRALPVRSRFGPRNPRSCSAPPPASPVGHHHPRFGQGTLGPVPHRPRHPRTGHLCFGQGTPGPVLPCPRRPGPVLHCPVTPCWSK